MRFSYRVGQNAKRYYSAAQPKIARRLEEQFELLESNAHPGDSKALKGELQGLWRIRVGNLRIIYEIIEESGDIRIMKIGPRGDIY